MPSLMDFLGTFTGSTGAKAVNNAAAAQTAGQEKAFAAADPILRNSYGAAKTTLSDSFQNAADEIRRGRTQVHENLNAAGTENRDIINTGYDRAQTPLASAVTRIDAILAPFADPAAARLRDQAIGVGGAEAQRQFYDNFMHDPTRDFRSEQITRQLANSGNAAGLGGNPQQSGRLGLMTTRALNESYSQDMRERIAQLERAAEMGGRYAATSADLNTRLAGQQSQLEAARTGALSGNLTQHRDLLARLYDPTALAALSTQYGTQRAGLEEREGGVLANLIAGKEVNLGNILAGQAAGKNAEVQKSMNNIINLGSKIASAAMGMPSVGGTTGGNTGLSGSFGSDLANLGGSYFTPEQLAQYPF